MATRKKSVWVVILCEIADPDGCVLETVKLVASSLKAAEAEVVRGWTAPFSWYRVERRLLDDSDTDPREVRYFSHKGRPQKSAPERRALFQFRQFVQKHGMQVRR